MNSEVSFYHAHIYFDETTRASAAALREEIWKNFTGRVRVHDLIDEPIGPHPLPMFEVDIPAREHADIKTWLIKHHGEHSILIHPLTGNDLADHRDHPQWIGQALKLDLEFLKRLQR